MKNSEAYNAWLLTVLATCQASQSIAGNARFPQFRKCSFPNSDEFVHGANKNYGPIPDVVKLGLAVVD